MSLQFLSAFCLLHAFGLVAFVLPGFQELLRPTVIKALFHWHVEDKGIRHCYIKPRSPQLNGKVERSHRSDQEEFYQLLKYKNDVDLGERLYEWEQFYNFAKPYGAHKGKTPHESPRELS